MMPGATQFTRILSSARSRASARVNCKMLELTVGDRLIGNFNFDGLLTASDIDLLCTAQGSTQVFFDLNGDGLVDKAGLDQFILNEIGTLYADANLDRTVDGQDFVLWNASKFQSGTGWATGDFNCDGITDGLDFVVWNSNKFQSAAAHAVPEPTCALLWLTLVGVHGTRKWRRAG